MSNYLIDLMTKDTKYKISGGSFGLRKAWGGMTIDYKGQNYHIGVDYNTPTGTPLYAIDDCIITLVQTVDNGKNYGRYVLAYVPSIDKTIHYAHMDTVRVKKGDTVAAGDLLGTSGNSGLSSAPHLHAGIASGKKTDLKKGKYGDTTWLNPSKFMITIPEKVVTLKSNEEIAQEVIDRKWGNNPERKNDLIASGYDYDAIQKIVNERDNQKPPVKPPVSKPKPPVSKPKPPVSKPKKVNISGKTRLFVSSGGTATYPQVPIRTHDHYTTLKGTRIVDVVDENALRVRVRIPGFNPELIWINKSELR